MDASITAEQAARQRRNRLSPAGLILPASQRRFSSIPPDAAYAVSNSAAAHTLSDKDGSIIPPQSDYCTVNL